jgi:hypothetical protein
VRSNNGSSNIDSMGPLLRSSSCTHNKNKSGSLDQCYFDGFGHLNWTNKIKSEKTMEVEAADLILH